MSQLDTKAEDAESERLHCSLAQARRELARQRTLIFFKKSLRELFHEQVGGDECRELGIELSESGLKPTSLLNIALQVHRLDVLDGVDEDLDEE